MGTAEARNDMATEGESGSLAAGRTLPCTVYSLVDPRTHKSMYVGVALDLERRFRQHLDMDRYDSNVEKKRWIKGLLASGLEPELRIVEACGSVAEADIAEVYWIKTLRGVGQAEFNKANGGRTNRGASAIGSSHLEDWFQLGREIIHVHEELMGITKLVGQLAGPTASGFALEVVHALDRFAGRIAERLNKSSRPELVEAFASGRGDESSP